MASAGTIIARVYTSKAQIPLPGVTVAFTQRRPGGKQLLLAARISDEDGKTAPVSIPTPDFAAGLAPGGASPFTLIDVWAESADFEPLRVEDVQLFPDTETIQDLLLLPLPEMFSPSIISETVQIPPQTL